MATAANAGGVLPRPRILNVLGILNLVVASALILMSVSLGGYTAIMPMTSRAITQMRKQADTDIEARKQADLKAIEEEGKTATTAGEKQALEEKRKAIEARPKLMLPPGMDYEKMGANDPKLLAWSWIEVSTALASDLLLLAAGIGIVRRRMWGIRLGLLTAAVKIVRLVLVYGAFALVVVPPIAQGIGRMAAEMINQQQQAMGRPMPPGLDPSMFTRIYFIMLTVMAVAIILFGSIYPAISLWFLSRPGACAACDERASRDSELTGPRVLGILNITFASCLILFGMCTGAYLSALPLIGKMVNQVQKSAERDIAAKQEVELKAIDEAKAKAETEDEKQDLEQQRKAITSRPKITVAASVDFTKMGFSDPKVQLYYWIDLSTGLILNLAMIAAGIALVRRKPWGITLGVGTAAAKIVRLALLGIFFALVASPKIARQAAEMVGKMMVTLQQANATTTPLEIDTSPLVSVYSVTYLAIAVLMFVMGSIYPAISLWVLARPAALAARDKSTLSPGKELNEPW